MLLLVGGKLPCVVFKSKRCHWKNNKLISDAEAQRWMLLLLLLVRYTENIPPTEVF